MRLRTFFAPMSIAVLALLAPSPAFADAEGTPRTSASAQEVHRINGAAVSSLPEDQRRLSVEGKLGSDGVATGRLSFTHQSPSGLSHFTARVTCLEFNDGQTEVSGTITKGETATGVVLDGKTVAFTLDTEGVQNFSLPQIGPGAASCGGGRVETVPVTEAGFHVR
ncbi:hypothetical protein [Arthrobacter sp. Hz1]